MTVVNFLNADITPVGITDWRNSNQTFGIRDKDRLGHIYAIGKTGAGKSTLLLNMAISDIESGKGLCIIDPHGDLSCTVLDYIPPNRLQDVIYFNATDDDFPIAFNPLYQVDKKNHNLIASSLISTFKKQFADSWGPRLEHILRYSLLTLLHYPFATLLDIQVLLTNFSFRTTVLSYVTDQTILSFWKSEFDKYSPSFRNEAIAPVLNKTGLLIASLPLRYIIGQQKSIDMQQVIDKSKILICNFSKGEIGEDASALLGSITLTAIQSAALSRASYETNQRVPFYLYVDEIQSFVTLSFADILAESRKYGLSLFLTHQYIEQLHEKVRAAVFGNVGTIISFRIGATDAEYLAKEFHPVFTETDFINLPTFSMYIKLMIDGATSKPFSAKSIPLKPSIHHLRDAVIKQSQIKYGQQISKIREQQATKDSYFDDEHKELSLFK